MSEDLPGAEFLIDEEFSSFIRPLDENERSRLEASIWREGCRNPLVVWMETGILLDGHNRYEICQAIGKQFETITVSLPDRAAARRWIINNQLARRNLTPNELSYLRGLKYEAEKLDVGRPGNSEKLSGLDTAARLANEYGVKDRTIRNDAEYARSIDILAKKEGPEFKIKALKGEYGKEQVVEAAKAEDWKAVLDSGSPDWWTPAKYMRAVREVMGGIDLDPASCEQANETVKAEAYYTEEDDGLNQIWFGRVFLNPPYGKEGPPFIEKFYIEYGSAVTEGIVLVNSRSTDADWYGPLFEGVMCFTDHRIDFDTPNRKAAGSTHGSCFIYFGPNEEKFAEVFAEFGNIVRRWPA